ncbi:GNAT family N-acetyltransferase [Salipaludibacillus sp. LMS25]|jgi:GNAT superfamily N-acetyltransferase|uniref:GNAT family N-acetyltransferase n=1 Tax=Salipaludibacillus sp. LMS25 TaxID=2924031 RepID=UPI0020D11F34|nr:GNAT family N-acetyltransferase [Salipaludibacillus sp. LMS25]UTR15396.1 GNAT family N-acetyltransferase [Salipaludibacillus sp. LMS25]
MRVYKVTKPANENVINDITTLMMEQMESLSVNVGKEALANTIATALKAHSGAEFFVAESDNLFVGAAFLNSGLGLDKGGAYIWLNDLYVKKDYRRQGIARKLLLNVLYWAEQHKFNGIELETGINNAATKKLYNSLGFYDIVSKRYGRTLTRPE